MYQGKNRFWCTMMLAVSMALRLCMLFGVDEALGAKTAALARNPDFSRFLLMLETGQKAQIAPEPLKTEPVVLYRMAEKRPCPVQLQAQTEAPAPRPRPEQPKAAPLLPTCLAEAGDLKIAGACTYAYDKQALLDRPTAMELGKNRGKILIVHAHGTEAYTPEPDFEYTPTAPYRTLDESRSVVAVGEALAQVLRSAGFEVIHNTTIHDYPDYNSSYYNTLQTIEAVLAENPDVQMVLDVHRDAAEHSDGTPLALCTEQNRQQAAQVMLVVGTDQGGLHHPDWQENLANGLKLQAVLDGQYPGLCRKLNLRTERFNQHVCPGAILLEVGTHGNTLTEALRSAELVGDALVRMLNAEAQYGGRLEPLEGP